MPFTKALECIIPCFLGYDVNLWNGFSLSASLEYSENLKYTNVIQIKDEMSLQSSISIVRLRWFYLACCVLAVA